MYTDEDEDLWQRMALTCEFVATVGMAAGWQEFAISCQVLAYLLRIFAHHSNRIR